MQLMVEANFIAVFIGIESPERGVAPRDQEVPERPRRAGRCWRRSTGSRTPGMEVWCGMIMGFDNDDATIFDAQIEFIQRGPDRRSR